MASEKLELYSPEYALEEIKKYEAEIQKKTGLSKQEFNSKREELVSLIEFVPVKEYSAFFGKLESIPDKDDIDFLGLALKLGCSLWSQDKALLKQSKVKIYSTEELLHKLH